MIIGTKQHKFPSLLLKALKPLKIAFKLKSNIKPKPANAAVDYEQSLIFLLSKR